jgi:bacterioferritin (cytochrome b1)
MHSAVIAQANHAEYREIVHYFGDKIRSSRVPMEMILAKEEEHADELRYLLFAVDPATGHKP